MGGLRTTLTYVLPGWLANWTRTLPAAVADDRAAMALAIEAARRNVRAGSGGPFGATVVEEHSRTLLAVGVNLVVTARASALHAEVLALLLAQQAVGSHDLSRGGAQRVALFTSAEPCAMCMGAIPWSGVRRVAVAARDADVRAIGFDEGDKPADWVRAYARRGITVECDLCRDDAVALLDEYRTLDGLLY